METPSEYMLDMCKFLLSVARTLIKTVDEYRSEVIRDRKMLEKRIVSILKAAYKHIQNILQQCDIYIHNIGIDKFQTKHFYKGLLEHINIYKTSVSVVSQTATSTEDRFILTNDNTVISAVENSDTLGRLRVIVFYSLLNIMYVYAKIGSSVNEENSITVKEEQLSECDSEETVLLDRDTNSIYFY